jgi:hypothetical protein
MDALWFLAGALVVIVLGTIVVLIRHRQPKGHDIGIRAHQSQMRALSVEARSKVVERAGLRQPERETGE